MYDVYEKKRVDSFAGKGKEWIVVQEITWIKESKKWLREIFDYIAADSTENAKKVIINIIEQGFPTNTTSDGAPTRTYSDIATTCSGTTIVESL